MFSPFAFYATFVVAFLPVAGFYLGAWWLTPLLLFGAMTVVDTAAGRITTNADEATEARMLRRQWLFDLPLYGYCVLHIGLIVWGAMQAQALSALGMLALAGPVGTITGALGITVAHELGHRRHAFQRFLSQTLLVWVSYGHFYIEHNRGHHVRIGTHDDPATSRLGESLYRFWGRSVVGSFVSAWQLEATRLARLKKPVWHVSNRMLQLWAATLAIAAGLGAAFGPMGVAFFAVQSFVAFSLLEFVNYIEHYGLTREPVPTQGAQTRYERVRPVHSWNDTHFVTNALVFNLQRHSDHHANPSTPYPQLRHHEGAPQLPFGYGMMIMLAHLPPVWRKLMDPRVAAWRAAREAERHAPSGAGLAFANAPAGGQALHPEAPRA
jgi:alkane 1-monooxygenase